MPKRATTLHRWRILARSFPCVERLTREDVLPEELYPRELGDFLEVLEHEMLPADASVFRFLLHVFRPGVYRFDLFSVHGWGPRERDAFTGWVTGETVGQPFFYCRPWSPSTRTICGLVNW